MPTAFAAWSVTATLAFSPFSFGPRIGWAAPAQSGWDDVEKKGEGEEPADSGGQWDNTSGENPDAGEAGDPTTTTTTTAPPPTPQPIGVDRPDTKKGTGLIIGAAAAGGVGWILSFVRMGLVTQCVDAVEDAGNADAGFAAAQTCWKAGRANLFTLPVQYFANLASWGLAAGAGVVRGKHDGVAAAWDGKPKRAAAAFIGGGAALLSIGVIGRIASAALVFRPFRALASIPPDGDKFALQYRLRLFGVQASSASIAAGLGLMVYGIVYNKNLRQQGKRLGRPQAELQVAPDFNLAPGSGLGYTGVALNGRF